VRFSLRLLPLLALATVACATTEPMVWLDKGVSLAQYRVVEVLPVANETGKTFEFDVVAALTEHLKEKLHEKGFEVAVEPVAGTPVLVLQSRLVLYEPGSAAGRWVMPGLGRTQCTVRSSLIDRRSGQVLGEIVIAEHVSGGGFYSVGADRWILGVVAGSIADELDKRAKGQGS
jgi:hypothetical protein